jgi:SAM-dependent methyltransferase
MDPALYPRMAAVEDTHWWFAARRTICERLLERVGLPCEALILEAGCGTGGNFQMLARLGRLYAMDNEPAALNFAASRGLAQLARGSLPGDIPFGNLRFDLAVMTDVLEHLDDESASLRALHSRLKPGGWLLLTVPALQWLWSVHDVTHHHRRRYRLPDLLQLLISCGYNVDYLSYYNVILFPAVAGVRILQRLWPAKSVMNDERHNLVMPRPWLNTLLLRLFASERYLLGSLRLPLGISLVALARA